MDMHAREQYLESLREEYRRAGKKQKKRLLNEARKRTHLNRKVLIRKLAGKPLFARVIGFWTVPRASLRTVAASDDGQEKRLERGTIIDTRGMR